MKIQRFATQEMASRAVAGDIALLLHKKPDALLCLAAGHTSLPVFDELVDLHARGKLDVSQARFVGLDEWLGVAPENPGSCNGFVRDNLLHRLGVTDEARICLFQGDAPDPQAECQRVEAFIDHCGGLDYLLLGMGLNGHLALNEPGERWDLGAHVAPLAATTKEVAPKYFPADMPPLTHGITLGLRNLLAARVIDLSVFGAHKSAAVQRLVEGEIGPAFPATALRELPGARLILDTPASAYLTQPPPELPPCGRVNPLIV